MARYITENLTHVGIVERFSTWGVYNSPRVILRVPSAEANKYTEFEMSPSAAKRLGNRLSKYGKLADG